MGYNPNSVNATQLPFSPASPGIQILCQLKPGWSLSQITVAIEVPFDDPAATISVGTSADPSRFFGSGDADLGVVGQYESSWVYGITAVEYMILTVNPGTSTTGTAMLYYQLRASP